MSGEVETKDQVSGTPASAAAPVRGVRVRRTPVLDAELDERLEATLDDNTKRLRAAETVLDALVEPEASESAGVDLSVSASGEGGAEEPQYSAERLADETSERELAVRLAFVAFKDGDSLEFFGIPQHGEIGLAYRGENANRHATIMGELVSPLRLFCSLTPPDVSLPWLLAAVDRQPDRAPLVGRRALCDRLESPVLAQDGPLRLRVPALAGGVWLPDDLVTPYHFCGPAGAEQFKAHTWTMYPAGGVGWGLSQYPIYHWQLELTAETTHNSTYNGQWKTRRCAVAWAAACESPVRITHQYRDLGFFKWVWKTARTDELGPSQLVGTPWLGIVRRRRRIIYERVGAAGGLRAFSRFAKTLTA